MENSENFKNRIEYLYKGKEMTNADHRKRMKINYYYLTVIINDLPSNNSIVNKIESIILKEYATENSNV